MSRLSPHMDRRDTRDIYFHFQINFPRHDKPVTLLEIIERINVLLYQFHGEGTIEHTSESTEQYANCRVLDIPAFQPFLVSLQPLAVYVTERNVESAVEFRERTF